MKKILFPLLAIGLFLTSCGKDDKDDNNGSATLDQKEILLHYGDTKDITPTLEGAAMKKSFTWTSSNLQQVTVEALDGGTGRVKAKKITSAPVSITYQSSDKKVSAQCMVTVDPRSNLLNYNPYLLVGQAKGALNTSLSPNFIPEQSKSTESQKVYSVTGFPNITYFVYNIVNETIDNTYIVLNSDASVRDSLQENAKFYLEERYDLFTKTDGYIKLYDLNDITPNLKAGIFLTNSKLGYDLGVKYEIMK